MPFQKAVNDNPSSVDLYDLAISSPLRIFLSHRPNMSVLAIYMQLDVLYVSLVEQVPSTPTEMKQQHDTAESFLVRHN